MAKIRPLPQHTSCRITTGVITAITANASLVADDGYAGRADGTTAVVAERKENGGWGRGQLRGHRERGRKGEGKGDEGKRGNGGARECGMVGKQTINSSAF